LERRRAELRRSAELLTPALNDLHKVYVRRWSRLVGGAVGIAGAVGLIVVALLASYGSDPRPEALPTYWLIGSALAAVAATLLTRIAFAIFTRKSFKRITPLPAPALDLARLEGAEPWPEKERILRTLELPSTALPLVALSLLAPLTLHLLFITFVGGGVSAHEFARWIAVSGLIVGHAHIALAVSALWFARKMNKLPRAQQLDEMTYHRDWLIALGATVGISAIPGIVFLLLPPIITAITGAAFVPAMYLLMHRRLRGERALMEAASAETTNVRVDAEEVATRIAEPEPMLLESDADPEPPRARTAAVFG
jgi:hypothetical protein